MGFLLLCIIIMGAIAALLFYIGIKVSYSFIRYSPAITLSVGVIFYLIKFMLTINSMELAEFAFDFFVLSMFFAVWFVAIVETILIDTLENGKEYKQDMRYLIMKISNIIIKPLRQKIVSSTLTKKFKTILLTRVPLKIEESQKENNG